LATGKHWRWIAEQEAVPVKCRDSLFHFGMPHACLLAGRFEVIKCREIMALHNDDSRLHIMHVRSLTVSLNGCFFVIFDDKISTNQPPLQT
jgi:hypothetical protein